MDLPLSMIFNPVRNAVCVLMFALRIFLWFHSFNLEKQTANLTHNNQMTQSFLKPKAEPSLSVGPGPYLHGRQSTSKILWAFLAALFPILIATVIFSGWNALKNYSVAVVCALLFEYLFELVTAQKSRIHDGSSILFSLLFCLLMPANTSMAQITMGVFVVIIFGKELFGGLGQSLFHPVLVGYVFMLLFFPLPPPKFGLVMTLLIPICGLVLIWNQFTRWQNTFFYLVSSGLVLYLLGFNVLEFSGFLMLIAFFFVTDFASSPITQEGRVLFSTLAGFFTAAFCSWMNLAQAATAAILISNATVPLIDHFVYLMIRK